MAKSIKPNSFSIDEIVDDVNSIFKINIAKGELQSCNGELIKKLYSLFVKDFGAEIETFNQIPIDASIAIQQNPELYRGHIYALQLTKAVQFFQECITRNEEFTLIDILSPKLDRTLKFLSNFIELYSFMYNEHENLLEIEQRVEYKMDGIERLNKEAEVLRNIHRKKQQEKAEEPACLEKLRAEVKKEKNEVKNLLEIKDRMRGLLDGAKTELAEMSSKMKEIELAILNNRDRVNSLKLQTVMDEDVVNYKRGSEQLQDLRSAMTEVSENLKEKLLHEKASNEEIKLYERLLSSFDVHSEQFEQYEKAVDELKTVQKLYKDIQTELEQQRCAVRECNENIAAIQLKKNQILQDRKMASAESQVSLQNLKADLDCTERVMSEEDKKKRLNEKSIQETERKVANLWQKRESHVKKVDEYLERIYDKYEFACECIEERLRCIEEERKP